MTPPTLPSVIAEIVSVAGQEAAWRLVEARGGTLIFLPRSAGGEHWLTAIVGIEAANKICRHFRDNHIDHFVVPKASSAQLQRRWSEVLARNLSLNETARAMDVHVRTVSRRRRSHPGDSGEQGSLF